MSPPRQLRSVVLLQLPVQSHDCAYPRENVPLGPALVVQWARGAHPDLRIELAPQRLVNESGDAALLDWLARERPDVLGLSCAVWNLERSLRLARELKRRRPGTFIVLGGPEIAAENEFLRAAEGFDAAVVGEGEASFSELLGAVRSGHDLTCVAGLLLPKQGWRQTAPRAPVEPLDVIPSPYLSHLLGKSPAGGVTLESVRGCPQRCAYCYYPKGRQRLRRFELSRVAAEIKCALEHGASELTFVDPSFARRPDFDAFLEVLRSATGGGRLPLRCELNAEDVTLQRARALARAGVAEVEIGLQTTHAAALRLAQRPFRPARFVEGVRQLRGEGIRILLDVMVGLPGDGLADVRRSVDFAAQHQLYDDLKVYPLCVLPGTQFRRNARELGLEYQSQPPYHVLRTATMSPEDIHDALAYAEQVAEQDLFPVEIPRPARSSGIVRSLVIRRGRPIRKLDPVCIGQALTVEVRDASWPARMSELHAALGPALSLNPFSLLSWIVPGAPFPGHQALALLERWAARTRAPHPIDRDWFATHNPPRSVQLFARFREALVRLPSYETTSPVVARPQRACWIAFSRRHSTAEEDAFVDRLAEHYQAHPDVWFRIGTTG
ncbi:MAG: B12-binding domain-containing radical SAM protein [Deltaproteobacteria bacterium]|nr:B12-binding domain-containing radical SAM protein [Deltaproteobacteria bacterium]